MDTGSFNSTITLDSSTLTPMEPFIPSTKDIIVGAIYITEAVIIISLHIHCSYLIYTDKDMKNPTYYFMINLSIVDILELSLIGIYAGAIILTRWHNETAARLASFFTLSLWYSNCVLFGLIAFARWVAITRPHMTPIIFK